MTECAAMIPTGADPGTISERTSGHHDICVWPGSPASRLSAFRLGGIGGTLPGPAFGSGENRVASDAGRDTGLLHDGQCGRNRDPVTVYPAYQLFDSERSQPATVKVLQPGLKSSGFALISGDDEACGTTAGHKYGPGQ